MVYLVGEHHKLCSILYGQVPLKLTKHWCTVSLPVPVSIRVAVVGRHQLEFLRWRCGCAKREGISIIQTCYHKSMYQRLGSLSCEPVCLTSAVFLELREGWVTEALNATAHDKYGVCMVHETPRSLLEVHAATLSTEMQLRFCGAQIVLLLSLRLLVVVC